MNDIQLKMVERNIDNRKRFLPEFSVDFLNSLGLDHSPRTQLEYTKDLQLFFSYLVESQTIKKKTVQELTLDDVKSITEKHILNFLDYLTKYKREFLSVGGNKTVQEFTNGPRGKERKRVTVHAFYEFLFEQGLVVDNPVQNVRVKVEKYTKKPRLTSTDLSGMFSTALYGNPNEFRAFRNHLILKLFAYTGIKTSELTNLNINDVWQSRDEFVVTRSGGEEEFIHVNDNIREDLYNYVELRKKIKNVKKGHENALFLSQQMRRMNPRSVRKMMGIVANTSGIDTHVTPHTFRLTFGWKHYKKHQDLQFTADVLGHSSSETTRYNYANKETKKRNL